MKLEKASRGALVAWILAATASLAVYMMTLVDMDEGSGVLPGAIILITALTMAVTAWQIDGLDGPVLEINAEGMTICRVFSTGTRIPWSDIRDVRIRTWNIGTVFRARWMCWLVIRLRDTSHIGALQWFLPPAWFARIAIPTRFVKGGAFRAREIVRASQGGLLDGGITHTLSMGGTDAILARGDAAIQRALEARTRVAAFKPRPSAHESADIGDAAVTHQRAITKPEQPAVTMTKGAHDQPFRARSFGRKRA